MNRDLLLLLKLVLFEIAFLGNVSIVENNRRRRRLKWRGKLMVMKWNEVERRR